jgi:Protein of unknown function (DUF3987)/Bifunctional DNA primase/polymerase, N-terminal
MWNGLRASAPGWGWWRMRAAAARAERARPDTREAAREYLARRWAVVPVPRRSKRPVLDGWQNGGFTASDVDRVGNVGILLGSPSDGLADVDLDCVEAIAAAPYFLPGTERWHGRASRRRSHAWYVVTDEPSLRRVEYVDPTRTREDGKKCTLVELRGTGCQTVVPPSVHPSGEAIEWDADGEPTQVTTAELKRAVSLVAACALIAPRWPDGARHDAALALAGLLRRGGMTEHDAERFVEGVVRVAADPEWRDRVRAVADTFAETGPTTGARRLAELMPDGAAVVAKLREWLNLKDHPRATSEEIPPLDLWGVADLTGRPVLDLADLPPTIAAMAADEGERLGVDAAMLALPALAVCATAIDDAHRIQPRRQDTGWTESARLWIAVVSPPGGKKSPALNRVVAPLRELEQQWHALDRPARTRYEIELRRYRQQVDQYVRRGSGAPPDEPVRPPVRRRVVSDATTEQLGEILADANTAVLAFYDELTAWLASHDCYRERAGRDRALWLSLYDGGPQVIDRVRRGHVAVPRWSACLLGGIQPGPLRRLVGRVSDDGLVQRLTIMYAQPPTEGIDREPDAIAGRAYDMLVHRLAALPAPSTAYTLSEEAHAEREIVATLARHVMVLPTTSEAMRGALAKWEGLFARLLLTYHLTEHADAPPLIVSGATAGRVARLIATYLLPHTARLYAELGEQHLEHSRWVAGYILARGLDGVSAREIGRAYRELRSDARGISDAMQALTLAGWVQPVDTSAKPGSPLSRWQVLPAVHRLYATRAAAERERRQQERERIAEAIRALGIAKDPEGEA